MCRFFPSHAQLAESTKSAPTPLSLARSKARRSAVRCRAEPCFLFRTYQTTLASIQSWRKPACPRAFIQQCEPSFSIFFNGHFFYCAGIHNSSTAVVCMDMSSLSREHSKTLHNTVQSPLHKAANQVRDDERAYQKEYVRTFMLRPVCFIGAWSSWHLEVACLHLKCWTIC